MGLQLIGFWADPGEINGDSALSYPAAWPHPGELPKRDWDPTLNDRICSYLGSGQRITSYMGYADCRFVDCGRQLGTSDCSDGTWVWPEGFEHYIDVHDIDLPQEFLRTAEQNGFEVPSSASDEPGPSSDAFWRRWCAEHTAPRPEAGALSLEAARGLMRELETPSFSLGVHEAHGRWAIELGWEAVGLVDYLHPTNESKLRRFLMDLRVVPGHALISQEEANRVAAEHPGPFHVHVTESGATEEGDVTWKYHFQSAVSNHSTDMRATDALGWGYQLDRWAHETEQELASAPSIETAFSIPMRSGAGRSVCRATSRSTSKRWIRHAGRWSGPAGKRRLSTGPEAFEIGSAC